MNTRVVVLLFRWSFGTEVGVQMDWGITLENCFCCELDSQFFEHLVVHIKSEQLGIGIYLKVHDKGFVEVKGIGSGPIGFKIEDTGLVGATFDLRLDLLTNLSYGPWEQADVDPHILAGVHSF